MRNFVPVHVERWNRPVTTLSATGSLQILPTRGQPSRNRKRSAALDLGDVPNICGTGCAGRDEVQAGVWSPDIEAVDRDHSEVDVKIHGCAETLRE